MSSETLYETIKQLRQVQNQPYYRILLAGYFNDDVVKKENINAQQFIKDTISPHLNHITGYLYIKGLFYIHLLESTQLKFINNYLRQFETDLKKKKNLHNQIRIVYQSYENSNYFFKGWECDSIAQSGPVLVETQKTEEQIADRSFEIYEALEDGAKKKKDNASHKISNMFLLSNDDMSLLICDRFMTLSEYHDMYLKQVRYEREADSNYPLPPSIFNIMEFLEIENYENFK